MSLGIDCALVSMQVSSTPVQKIAPAMARRQSVSNGFLAFVVSA
jgi:hypothetical protein